MAVQYRTRGLVFKRNNVGEADRIFSVFTDSFGRLDIFAKSIRSSVSKLRSGIDTFFLSDIEFIQGKNKKTLTDALVIEKFNNISKDLEKFSIANRIGEFLDNFIKGEEKDKEIFNLLNDALQKLDSCGLQGGVAGKNQQLIYYYFLWNSLSLLGYRPQVQMCNVCRKELMPHDIHFSEKIGGVICKNCLPRVGVCKKINSDVVKILRLIFKKEWGVLSKLKVEPSSQKMFVELSDDYYSYILSSHSNNF